MSNNEVVIKAWEHKAWGDNIKVINSDDMEKITIAGWLTKPPDVGDSIHFRMNSGKVAAYGVASVDDCDDPPDMFFADLEFTNYVTA